MVARELGVNRNTAFGWARQAGRRSVRAGAAASAARTSTSSCVPGRAPADGRRAGRGQRAHGQGLGLRASARAATREPTRRAPRRLHHGDRHDGRCDLARWLTALDKQLHPRFLTLAEREKIRDLRASGQSLRAIGRALGRPAEHDQAGDRRELRQRRVYRPYAAHRAAAAPQAPAQGAQAAQRRDRLRRFVADGLRRRWSPEQICHALRQGASRRREHAGEPRRRSTRRCTSRPAAA